MNQDLPDSGAPQADVTRVQSLAAIVRTRILTGHYRAGSWIREVELQREFGLSNGPVREALQGVVAAGLAERAPFRGVRVIDLDVGEIVELFEVRYALLGFAAELAAEKAGPETAASAAALKLSLAQPQAADLWLHGDFSRWVFGLAGNARLREAYERPFIQSLLYVSVARKHGGNRDELLPFVHRVIDAIVAGKPARARRAVRALTAQTLLYVHEATRARATLP